MPVLSLPLSLTSNAPSVWFPLRIPFTMMPRIGSILPASINGPFKSSLMALFRLAWSNKIQLPLLITVCFMAFDIRLQLEINIFWEPPRPSAARQRQDRAHRIANANYEAVRQAAVNAALLHRQRQRQLLEERARQDNLNGLNGGRHNFPAIYTEENSQHETTDTSDEVDLAEDKNQNITKSKNKKKRRLKKDKKDEDEEEEEDSDSEDLESDDDKDMDDDDNENGSGASQNPDCFNGDSDGDEDFSDGNSQGRDDRSSDDESDDSTGGATPLVVELEIRQRPAFKAFTTKLYSIFMTFSSEAIESIRSISVPCESVSQDPFHLITSENQIHLVQHSVEVFVSN